MKRFGGWLVLAFLTVAFVGCNDGAPTTAAPAETITKDGRSSNFEDMMKGMDKNMTKGGAPPKSAAK